MNAWSGNAQPVANTTQPRSSRPVRSPGVSVVHMSKCVPESRIHKSPPKVAGSAADKDAMHFPVPSDWRTKPKGCAELLASPSTKRICQCANSQLSPFEHPAAVPWNLQAINFLRSSAFLLGGQRDPWRGKKVPKRFFACGFGFAAAFGFGSSLTLESICLNMQRFSNLHIPSLLKE